MLCFVLTDIVSLFIVTYPGNHFHTYVKYTLHITCYGTMLSSDLDKMVASQLHPADQLYR